MAGIEAMSGNANFRFTVFHYLQCLLLAFTANSTMGFRDIFPMQFMDMGSV